MTLDKLKVNQLAIIHDIKAEVNLKSRFNSLGITKETNVQILAITLAKKTLILLANDTTKVALRFSEAKKIEVYDVK